MEKRWKYKKGTKTIIIRDQLEKVTDWVNKFKQIGDIAVQYDPAHAALPWTGVRFFLQVRRLELTRCCILSDARVGHRE